MTKLGYIVLTMVSISAAASEKYTMVDLQGYEIRQAIADHYKNETRFKIKEDAIQFNAVEGVKLDKAGKAESIDLGFAPHGRSEYCTVNINVADNNQMKVSCQSLD